MRMRRSGPAETPEENAENRPDNPQEESKSGSAPESAPENGGGKKRYTKSSIMLDEMQSRLEAKQRRRLVFYILLFSVIFLAFLAVSFFVFFRVREIDVTGNNMYTDEQILEFVSFHTGDNLFSFDASKAEANLRKNLPYLGSVSITRKLPSAVSIEVSERTEDLAYHLGDEIYLVSGDLQVLGRYGANEVIPDVTVLYAGAVGKCIVGETLTFLDRRTEDNLKELYACLAANGLLKKVRSIDITSRFDITLNYEDRFTVYLASADNMDIKIKFLSAILERFGTGESGYINLADHREAAVRLND